VFLPKQFPDSLTSLFHHPVCISPLPSISSRTELSQIIHLDAFATETQSQNLSHGLLGGLGIMGEAQRGMSSQLELKNTSTNRFINRYWQC
jgi:hypothetical protein